MAVDVLLYIRQDVNIRSISFFLPSVLLGTESISINELQRNMISLCQIMICLSRS